MFLILLKYKQPIEVVDEYLVAHREHLDQGYQKDYLVASGPRSPRTGGVLISQLKDKQVLEDFLKQDPYSIYDIAHYEIIEFTPVKYHPDFAPFIA